MMDETELREKLQLKILEVIESNRKATQFDLGYIKAMRDVLQLKDGEVV